MATQSWLEKFKERKVGQTLAVYLGSSWVFIEAFNFLIDKYHWDAAALDIIVLLIIFGLPATVIYAWFEQTFTRTAIVLFALNGLLAISVIGYSYINPNSFKPTNLRLLKFKEDQKELAESIRSMVILPFNNYTGSDEFEYYAAGMHSALIGDVGKVSALRVISPTSSKVFRGTNKSIPEIAATLGVDAVIESSVSCIGADSVCIQLQLISAYPEEQQLWVKEFYVEKSQIENFYHNVTKQISAEINIILTPQEEKLLAHTNPVNPEAYDAYLKGKYYWDQLTPEGLQKALEYFNLAIEKDPEWGPPYAGIAEFWIGMRQMGLAPSSVTIPNIYKYLDKATELDPNSANTLYVNGLASVWTGFNWEKGEKEFLDVLDINPNDSYSHAYYAHLLMFLKKGEKALEHSEKSLELDPLNPLLQGLNAVVLMHTNNHQKAILQAEQVLSIVPGHPLATTVLWMSNDELGNFEVAIQAMIQTLRLDKETADLILETYNKHGILAAYKVTSEFLEVLAETSGVINIRLAYIYLKQQQVNSAVDWLEKIYEIRGPDLPYMMTGFDAFKVFETNARYIELQKKMALPIE